MMMIKKLVSLTAISVIACGLAFSSLEAQDNANIVAKVNGVEITKAQVEAFYKNSPAAARGMPLESIQDAIVDQLISTALIDQKIEKSEFAKKDDVKMELKLVREQVLRDLWLKEQVEERLTDDYLKQRYEDFVAQMSDQYEIKARHILLDTQEEALEVVDQLENGAEFASLATEKSIGPSGKDGGDLGYFTKGAMVPAFSEKAFALEVGEFSKEPVETQFGWHVILVEDKKAVEAPSFDEMRQRLEAEASRELLVQIVEDLQKEADITRLAP